MFAFCCSNPTLTTRRKVYLKYQRAKQEQGVHVPLMPEDNATVVISKVANKVANKVVNKVVSKVANKVINKVGDKMIEDRTRRPYLYVQAAMERTGNKTAVPTHINTSSVSGA